MWGVLMHTLCTAQTPENTGSSPKQSTNSHPCPLPIHRAAPVWCARRRLWRGRVMDDRWDWAVLNLWSLIATTEGTSPDFGIYIRIF